MSAFIEEQRDVSGVEPICEALQFAPSTFYVMTWSGTVYVAFVIDAFSRRIVGWKAGELARRPRRVHLRLHAQARARGVALHHPAGEVDRPAAVQPLLRLHVLDRHDRGPVKQRSGHLGAAVAAQHVRDHARVHDLVLVADDLDPVHAPAP
jgi:transposase InsO family protein